MLGYDVEFTHEVTAEQALFWSDAGELTTLLDTVAAGGMTQQLRELSDRGRTRISEVYQWDSVTDQYEELILRLAASRRR